MRIKEVEDIVGISRKNIRFYEKEGLLSPGRESENSYRDYGEADLKRLKQIKLLRKLNMPLSEIKAILEGECALSDGARRHCTAIAEQRDNLLRALELCQQMESEGCTLAGLDVDAYLNRLENMEKEGAVFSNIVKNDVMKKYIGPILSCAFVIFFAAALLIFFLWTNKADPAPIFVVAYFCAVAAVLALGTIAALGARIKEIRKGEEDDLGNY